MRASRVRHQVANTDDRDILSLEVFRGRRAGLAGTLRIPRSGLFVGRAVALKSGVKAGEVIMSARGNEARQAFTNTSVMVQAIETSPLVYASTI